MLARSASRFSDTQNISCKGAETAEERRLPGTNACAPEPRRPDDRDRSWGLETLKVIDYRSQICDMEPKAKGMAERVVATQAFDVRREVRINVTRRKVARGWKAAHTSPAEGVVRG